MKIITSPTVTVVWGTLFYGHPNLMLPPDGDNATKVGAFAAKTCYRSFGEKGRANSENQKAIMSSGHGRILEHISYGLHITGVSRALGNELITHKAGITVSQESTRYVTMEDAGIVLEPDIANLYIDRDKLPPSLEQLLDDHINAGYDSLKAYELQYADLMKWNPRNLEGTPLRKWARGKARNVLPLMLETSMVVTGNLRAWRHFIEMRSEKTAEAEIRRLTHHIFVALQTVAPMYFEDYTSTVVDGIPEYTTEWRKV